MVLYFNHAQIPDGLPPNAVLWPELDGTGPRTERETYEFVKTLPNDAVILTNSSVALFTARTLRAKNPSLYTLDLNFPDGYKVSFDQKGRSDDWSWYDDVISGCIDEILMMDRPKCTENADVKS